MLKVSVYQPPYYAGEHPDEKIAELILSELDSLTENSLTVFPEYSNAGGLSDGKAILSAIPRAEFMLARAAEATRKNSAYVAINVIEERKGRLMNSTYLFDKEGNVAFVYDKIHLPPSEVSLGVSYGSGECVFELDGIRFGFMTCYDVYFSEQIEHIAKYKPDIILVPGYQRGERTDIILAQAKLLSFRTNAFVLRSSYSMDTDERGGCSMIVSPSGDLLANMGKNIGKTSLEIDPHSKYMRTAGFGGGMVRNDDFISEGVRPDVFK